MECNKVDVGTVHRTEANVERLHILVCFGSRLTIGKL